MTIQTQLFPLPASKQGGNTTLGYARKRKRDEFYTRAEDIRVELDHYRDYLRGKRVYCNCDSVKSSQFWRVLLARFHEFELKWLAASCYTNLNRSTLHTYDGKRQVKQKLDGDGDFRSPECQAVMKVADVVITNPPFSLILPFVFQLLDNDKDFLVIANLNTFMNKRIIENMAAGHIRMGVTARVRGMKFRIPGEYKMDNTEPERDADGNRIVQISTVRWFTTIDHGYKPDGIKPEWEYNPAVYPTYDNFEAIEVSKTKRIPTRESYDGMMGVPITFLDHYRLDQFELLGVDRHPLDRIGSPAFSVNGEYVYKRLLIAHKGSGHAVDYRARQAAKEKERPTLL